jgi:hypothetical protein
MLAFVRVSCVVWAIGVWGWLRDVCLMCNGPDRSNPPSTSARGGPGGRARGGNGCEGGDGCLRAVLQSLLAAPAGLLALLSLPNMFFSRFTTCLRAAKSARRARWASRPSLAAEHVFLSLHYLSPRCCHASHALCESGDDCLRAAPGPSEIRASIPRGLEVPLPSLRVWMSLWTGKNPRARGCREVEPDDPTAAEGEPLGASTGVTTGGYTTQAFVVATRFRDLPDFVFRVCAIGTSLWFPLHHHPCNGLHAALTLQWIACCSYPKSPNRRGSPSGAETSGGPRHSLVTPGQGVSRVTFG